MLRDPFKLTLRPAPVSALVFQAEPLTSAVMARPPRNPAAPILPRPAVVRSAASGAALATVSFAMYWWQLHAVGESQARGLALVVLLAGYQTLIFAERLALPELSIELIPRTLLFWTVWCVAALSLVLILYLPPVAQLFGVVPAGGAQVSTAMVLGVVAVGWRLMPRGRRTTAPSKRKHDHGES